MVKQDKQTYAERYPGQIDRYPTKDYYIPQAVQEADKVAAPRVSWEWTRAFLGAMDTILVKKGLRFL